MPKNLKHAFIFLTAAILTAMSVSDSRAASGTWTSTASGGLWSATANWSSGIVADASGSTADFSTINITADPTVVHLDSARTNGSLIFGDTTTSSAAGWLLDNNAIAGNILTLAGTTPTITVNALGTGKTATISGVIAGTAGLTKSGPGTLSLSGANTFTGGLIVSAGELDSSGSVSGPGAVTVGNSYGTTATLGVTGGTIALGGNTFVIGSGTNNTYIGVVNQSGGTVSFTGGTAMLLGNGTNTVATYNLSGGTLTSGTLSSSTRGVMIGVNNGCSGTFNLSGTGTLSLGLAELAVGREDASVTNNTVAYNQNGGTATVGYLSIGGGLISTVGNVATFNLTNGTFVATNFQHLTAAASSSASIYLGGGAQVTLPAFPTPAGTVNLTLDFTNGYLSPLVANLNYLSGLANVYLTTNGANFNVGVSNITISQILQNAPSQAGTLKKTGIGSLTLSSVNTYSGATTISAGELMGVTGGSLASSAVAVTPTSGVGILGVNYTGGNAQWTCSSLSFNAGGTGTALEFAFNTAPSTSTAPLNVAGNLTFGVTPSVTVDVPNVTAGTYPLIVVGGTAPSAVPTLNWSPSARQGTLSGSLTWGGSGNKTLILTVTGSSVEPLNWSTSTVGTWDVNNSANTAWKNSAAVPASAYYQETGNQYQNDQVVFGDTYITANTTVTNLGTLTPASVTFNNSTYNYTNVGSGVIAGGTTLTKSGTAALTLSTANTYIGGTTINQGTVNATVAGALGGGVVTNNGVLNLTAGAAAYTGLSTGMSGSGTVNVTLGTGSATTFLNGNNAGFTGTLNVGTNGMTAAVAATAAGKLQMNGALANNTAVNILSNSTVYISTSVTNGAALYLYGGDTGESFGQLRIEAGSWAGPITLAGPVTGTGDGHIGGNSGTATITGNIGQMGGAQSLVKVGGSTIVLAGTNTYTGFTTNVTGIFKFGSTGALGDGVNNTAGLVLSSGTVDFAGFSPLAIVPLLLNSTANGSDVGSIESSTAAVVNYGGTVAIGASTLVFGTGSFLFTNTVTGNSKNLNKNGTGNVELTNSGAVTLGGLQINRGGIQVDSGSTLNVTSLNIGTGNSVGSLLVLNGGSISNSGSSMFGAGSGSASGTLTLNSGTLTVTNLAKGAVTFNLNFNGGILKAGADNPYFLTNVSNAKVQAGNAYIDDGGYAIAIAAPLVADTVSGGLIKLGSGSLTLSNLNTYTAGTTVSNGTLVLATGGGTGAIRNNLNIQSGAVVSLAIGDAMGFNGGVCVTNVNIYGGMLTNAGAGFFQAPLAYYNLSGGTVASAGGPFSFSGRGIASLSNSTLSVFSAPVRFGSKSTLTLSADVGTVPGGVDLSIAGNIYQGAGISGSSVIKTGAGVVQLNGANTYDGSTSINAGTLALGATATLPNTTNITVAAGAIFDLSAVSSFALGSSQALGGSGTVNGSVADNSGSQFNPGGISAIGTLTITNNLTLAGSDTLNFDFSAGGSNDVISVGGTVTPNGTTTINLANWPVGGFLQTNYVLIQASSLAGSVGSFTLANVPTGGRQNYSVVYDTSGSPQKVLLQVSGFNANLVWQGGSGNAWDVFTTQDWLNGGSPDWFFTSDNVLFSNVPPANTVVTIQSPNVAPGSVTINSTNNYVFNGGYITGSAGLVKNGSGSVTLTAANDYTGGTTINNGALQLGDGVSNNGSVAGAIVNNASLVVSNASSQVISNAISGSGQTVAGGSAPLTLSGNISGSGQVIATGSGGLTLSVSNSYTGGTTVNGTLIAANVNSLGAPTSTVLATVNSGANLAYQVAGTQTLTNQIVGGGSLTYSNSNPGSTGGNLNNGLVGLKLAVSNSFSGGLKIIVGSVYAYNNNALGTGPVTLDNGNGYGSYGFNQLYVGNGLNISNAITVVNASDYFNGVLMVDPGPNGNYGASDTNGGTFSGPITVAVGANIAHGGLFCGPGSGTNYLVIAGPVTNLNSGAGIGSRNGRVRFSGGGDYASFGVGGGFTQIGANNGICTNASLQLSGGSFDLNGYNQSVIGIANTGAGTVNNSSTTPSTLTLNLSADSTYPGVIAGNLSLVESGSANLILSGTNTYTGNTIINGGTLKLTGNALLKNTASISVSSNATLDVSGTTPASLTLNTNQTLKGDGAFTVLGSLASSGTIELKASKIGSVVTNDSVNGLTAITYGGTLKIDLSGSSLTATDSFKLFSASSYSGAFTNILPATPGAGLAWDTNSLAVDGTLAIQTGVATNPTNITVTVSGSSLILSWPADHTGWTLQAQTNSLTTGLGTNWVDVSGSTSVNSVTNTIDSVNGSVFYRLKY